MKRTIEILLRLVAPPAHLVALLLAVCAVGSAWAAAKPLAVWNGDFTDGDERGGYKLTANGNTIATDTITIGSSGGGVIVTNMGVTVDLTSLPLGIVAGFEDSGFSASTVQILSAAYTSRGADLCYFGGISSSQQIQPYYKSNGTPTAWTNNRTLSNTVLWTGSGLHYFASTFSAASDGYGWRSYVDGSLSSWNNGMTSYNNDRVSYGYGYTLGGSTGGYNLSGAKIKYIAVVRSSNADDIAAWSPTNMTSACSPATGTTLSSTDNETLAIQGINLPTDGYITISGDVTVAAVFAQGNSEIRFVDENSSLTVSGPVYVADSNTLTITPAALSASGTKTLITASVIGSASNLSVTPPTESGYTYTASVGDTAVTLTRKPVPSKTYTAAIGSWTASGWGSFAGGTEVEKVRVGPNAALSTVFEISSGFNPYVGFQAPSSSSWSFSVYADVSKASNSTTSRPILACFGSNNSSDTLLLYREGDYVKLRRQKNGAAVADWAASVPVADGFHLWTFACDPTTGTVTLYDDAGNASSNTGDSSYLLGEMNLPAGFQLGKVYGANLSGFTTGEGIAVASFQYYDTYITADDVAMLAAQYPATDGTAIYGQVDNLGAWNNHQNQGNTMGSSLTVYSGAYPDDTTTGKWVYLGISQGTLTIPSGNTVSVPFFKTNNKSSAGNVTVNIAGALNVTSTADSDIYSANKGILFGHYKGTGTYDITGELIGRSTYLMGCFSAGDQTINVNGGLLAVKGFSMRDGDGGNATVNLTNNGTVEVAAAQTLGNKDVIRNFGYGTYKVVADVTDSKAITFTGTAEQPTTLDPAGHTLTLNSAAMGGTGYMTVADSVGGGSVVFVGSSTATLILTDANAANIDISGYTGKVLYQGTAATLAKLNGFAGTVYFTSTVDASAIDLSRATVNVAAGCTYTAIAGQEGTMVLASGATAKLMVTTEVSNYEGHVASVSGAGTLEYWLSDGEQTQLTGEDHINGNNLLPYYYVWTPSETASENTISANAAARWKVGSLPTANKNVAFKISGATTVLVDATVTYGEVQVYGTGILTFQSADGTAAMTVAKKLQTTSTTAVQIDSGIVFGAGAELEVVSALPLYMTAVNCGTEAAPYEIPAITGGGIAYVAEGKYLTTAKINAGTFYALGNATVTNSAAIGTLQVQPTGVLTLDSAAVAVSGTATISGTVNVNSASTFNPSAVSGAGTVVWTGKQPDCTKSSSSVWVQSSWSGTNVVVNVGVYNTEIFPQYWGRDGSYIRVSKVMGYITNNNRVNAELILDNGEYTVAFQPANGNSNDNPVTLRKITGDGTLKDANNNGVLDYIIRDATEYTGSIDLSSGSPSRAYVFSSASTTYPARDTYKGCIYVNTDGYAKIGDGKSWSVASGKAVHILGEVELAGAGSISGPVTVSGTSAKLTLANSALSLNSALTLSEGYALEIDPGEITLSTTPVALITGLTNADAPDVSGITVENCTVTVGGESGAYTICAAYKNTAWSGVSGDWTEASFNGGALETDGEDVSFVAGASGAVAVTLTGTRAPVNVVFNGGSTSTYTLTGGTFSPSGTVAIESGSVVISSEVTSGVAFSVAAGAKLTLSNATGVTVSGSGELCIAEGGTVTLAAIDAIDGIASLSGSGSLVLPSAAVPGSLLQTLLKNSNWSGTVAFSNLAGDTTTQQWRMYNYGNSGSKIQFTNCIISYPINDNNDEYSGKLVLDGDNALKFTVDNGYSNNRNLLGELIGSGTLTSSGDNTQLYMFLSSPDFNGNISTTGKRIMFASQLSDGTANYANDTGAWAGTVRVASGASASIGAGANWVAFNGFGIYGTLIVKGANSYLDYNNSGTKGIILNNGATIRFDSLSTLKFGNSTLRTPSVASGSTVNIAFGDGVDTSDLVGTTLISWGGAPEGEFAFADSSLADNYCLVKTASGLEVAQWGVVTLTNGANVTSITGVANGDKVKPGDTVSFTVATADGYDAVVMVGNETLTADNGTYSYTVAGNVTITVTTVSTAVTFGAATFDYYATYASAKTVTAQVTGNVVSGTTFTLTAGGNNYTGTYENGIVTFSEVAVGGLGTTTSYTITATGGSTGTSASSATVGSTAASSGWMQWSESQTSVGGWQDETGTSVTPVYSEGAAAFSGTNIYTAAWTSTGEVVTVTTSVSFGSPADSELKVDADAQAAIRIGTEQGANVFQVYAGPTPSWGSVYNDTLGAPEDDVTYALTLTLNYADQTFGVSVGGAGALTNAAGGAAFPLAKAASAMQQVSYLGAGSFISLSGEYVSAGYTADVGTDGSATNVVVSSDFVSTYLRNVLASNVSAALSPTNTAKQANGLNYFASYALGLDPTDEDDKPTIKVETNSEGKFVVTLTDKKGNVLDIADNVAVTLSVKTGATPESVTDDGVAGEIVDGEGSAEGKSFVIDPSKVDSVKYYKVRIDIGAK